MLLFASVMPASSVSMVSASWAPLVWRSSLKSVLRSVSISFSWISALQKSFFLTSSSCSTLSIPIILSIAAFTLVKALSSTDVASNESCGLCVLRAAILSAAAACCLRCEAFVEVERWMKPKVLDIASRASSPVRTSIARVTTWISSVRLLLRAWKFLSAFAQVSSRPARNSWLLAAAACSCPRSSFAPARLFCAVASSSSFCSDIFSAVWICEDFAERSSSKELAWACSFFCASDKSASISSLSCFKTPMISPLWAL
mmetsp:Transcript_36114/g.100247  ORF Transcript_36114/g.100247 Transcript_36114/m.100247 type:complete len:258 (-) Transcript_36114:1088-1861(-)